MDAKTSRMDSLTEWATNNYGRHTSVRFARKYLERDGYFWAAIELGLDRRFIRRSEERPKRETPDPAARAD